MTSHRLVIDTNVLISAVLSSQGAPARLVSLALQQHTLVFSQPTFDELRTRLYRPKFDRYISLENRQQVLHDFNAIAHWVEIPEPEHYCRDRDDDTFVETARAAGAELLISGDKDLLEAISLPEGLHIVTAAQALELLKA
ncbi:putative toxin-antitoxin system toxin component, PIN family [Rhodoferax lacus]|uniref:Putative toxin-antitoxin system toxin component, PIN family n=1 Tax=Rhodoferax lacus TaxID=2184758 RepID=A0A3E1RFM3_9BURK|nr:putative toxin-antitoxin system toxin component, PIN family [Rhodoferax lacus]RFO98041.1 putative toxin-antitoxin system toxin component, PIN family [Rhodoferax lacus]